jgi:plasmid stabilization system protein ParE
MRVVFHPEALAQFESAAGFYESREPGLGARFSDAVAEVTSRIAEAPTTWRVVAEDVRRCLTHVFPYGVIYTIEPEWILIIAVGHLSREPGYWKSRLERR